MNLSKRSDKNEILDSPSMSKRDLIYSLRFMEFVNRNFGGIQAVLDQFDPNLTPESFTVLDVATGSGDMARALSLWGQKHQKKISITAIDLNEDCLHYARVHNNEANILYLKHSAFEIESLGEFDYTVSSMFFHHLTDVEIQDMLNKMLAVSRRGIVVNDLHRSFMGVVSAFVLSLLSFRWVVIHDATLSVMRAFKKNELEDMIQGVSQSSIKVFTKPWFRLVASSVGRT